MTKSGFNDLHRNRPSAVAIKYDQSDSAPRVVAKGYGSMAERIIRTAKENDLYVHESPELVGLLMQVNLDQHIPPELYQTVAELLAWLYMLDSKQDELPAGLAAPDLSGTGPNAG